MTSASSSRGRMVLLFVSALLAAVLIVAGGIMPAQFNRDPLGLGRLTGISDLWTPGEVVERGNGNAPMSRSYAAALRDDRVVIRLAPAEDPDHGDELEYKVAARRGGAYVYSWSVEGIDNPEEFYTEFHGHTLEEGTAMRVAYYRKATGTRDRGVLTAPFDGVHGWYFQNQSLKPVTVTLRIAGFYDLIPAGRPGNERGFAATPVE